MKKLFLIMASLTFVTQSCEPKKEINNELAENSKTYDNALDVPVGKLGVIINIDSLGFFDHNSQDLNTKIDSKYIKNQLHQLNSTFDINQIIKDKSIKILNENHYKYDIINQYNKADFPKDLVTNENLKNINFDLLNKNYKQDDLVLLNIKSGLDYNPEDKQKYVAKTYVYINILDLKNKVLKYSETIGGTKYIDEAANKISTKSLEEKLNESLNETLEIIDNKY